MPLLPFWVIKKCSALGNLFFRRDKRKGEERGTVVAASAVLVMESKIYQRGRFSSIF